MLLSKMPEYNVWQNMKQRCYNINNKAYTRYGGRGIKICDQWLTSFHTFVRDMGLRPSVHHQIDRIDNDKGYNPENCKWSSNAENSNNKRNSKLWYINGEKFDSLRIAADNYNIPIRELRRLCNNKLAGCYCENKY